MAPLVESASDVRAEPPVRQRGPVYLVEPDGPPVPGRLLDGEGQLLDP
jgi:hypothetical protein